MSSVLKAMTEKVSAKAWMKWTNILTFVVFVPCAVIVHTVDYFATFHVVLTVGMMMAYFIWVIVGYAVFWRCPRKGCRKGLYLPKRQGTHCHDCNASLHLPPCHPENR